MYEGMVDFGIKEIQLLAVAIDSAANMTKAIDDLIKELNKVSQALMKYDEKYDSTVEDNADVPLSIHLLDENPALDENLLEIIQTAIRISCVTHKLQLAINKFLWGDEEVSKLLSAAMNLAKKLRTPIVKMKLKAEHEHFLSPLLNQVTRWNSTFAMIQRLLTLKSFCQEYESDEGLEALKFSDQDWKKLQELEEVLKEPSILTTKLQGERVLVTDVIYEWLGSVNRIEEMTSEYAKRLSICIKKRTDEVIKNKIVIAGWYLDKNLGVLLDEDQIKEARKVILMVAEKKYLISSSSVGNQEQEIEIGSEDGVNMDSDDDENISSFEKRLRMKGKAIHRANNDTKASTQLKMKPRRKVIEAELEYYERMNIPNQRTNSITWWNAQKDSLPILSCVALDIICVPLSEVSVERLFSHLKFIIGKYSSTMKQNLLEDILFLRLNDIFDFETL